MTHVLDRPVWHSLTGALAHLALREGSAAMFDPEISGFAGTESDTPADWADLRRLVGPRRAAVLFGSPAPEGARVLQKFWARQMVAEGWAGDPDPEAIELGPADAPEMLDLATRTKPGPFQQRTPEVGRYVGISHEGRLVAMAGERMHPPGYTEVSAVCTDPDFRGRGLAERLVRTIAAGIIARGETPFLHVSNANTTAIRLYERMGFATRRDLDVVAFMVPAARP